MTKPYPGLIQAIILPLIPLLLGLFLLGCAGLAKALPPPKTGDATRV